MVAALAWGCHRLRTLPDARPAAAAAALGLFVLLFVSPLCALTSALFSVRVAHHVVLVAAMAPLLVLAVPARALRLTGSLAAWTAAQTVVYWAWHAPPLYAWALSHDAAYWLMQVSLLGVAIGFWSAARRASAPAAAAALLATMVQMGLLGALLTFSADALYAPHLASTLAWGFTPLQDQQLAGLDHVGARRGVLPPRRARRPRPLARTRGAAGAAVGMIEKLRAWARTYTDQGRYSPVGVAFHWIMAALVIFQLAWGIYASWKFAGGDKVHALEVHGAVGLPILRAGDAAPGLAAGDPRAAQRCRRARPVADHRGRVTVVVFYICFFAHAAERLGDVVGRSARPVSSTWRASCRGRGCRSTSCRSRRAG